MNHQKKTRTFLLLLVAAVCIILFPRPALSLSVGMAPPVYDLGSVEPGKQYYIDFYIISDQDKDIVVDLQSTPAPYDFYLPERPRFRYTFNSSQCSEEDISGWITFLDNPVIVPPEKRLYKLSNGGLANANKKVTAVISIPKNAEPGYHAGHVIPRPRQQAQGGGTGLGIVTIAKMGYVFRVEGDAVRSGKIIGIVQTDRGLSLVFKNTGTVTMTVKARNVKIFEENGTLLTEMSSRQQKFSPGETAFLFLGSDSRIKEGYYPAEATVEWIGGSTHFKGIADITAAEKLPITAEAPSKQAAAPAPPLWLLSLIIIFISLALYRWKK